MNSNNICIFVGRGQMVVKQMPDAPALPTVADVEKLLPADAKLITVHANGADLVATYLAEWPSSSSLQAVDFRPLFLTMRRDEIGRAHV